MTTPRRPVLRYHGGKWRLAPWIISQFPPHDCYVEPFGGGASVLLQKPRTRAECYNDLDGAVVNVFRVLRDPESASRLRRLCQLTPFSREEFDLSFQPTGDPVEWARRILARSFMAHGTTWRKQNRTGFRAVNYRERSPAPRGWRTWPENIPSYVERLRWVTIENRDALEVIAQHDARSTLFYVDPPYPLTTRTSARGDGAIRSDRERAYAHDLENDDHSKLAQVLRNVEGMVVLSGYHCPLYDELFSDWEAHDKAVTEVLWLNRAAVDATRRQLELRFDPRGEPIKEHWQEDYGELEAELTTRLEAGVDP